MIEVIGLTKHYGKTVAVDDLSFTVLPGAVTGFLGFVAGWTEFYFVSIFLNDPSQGFTLSLALNKMVGAFGMEGSLV